MTKKRYSRFGAELRRLRTRTDLTQATLVGPAGYSVASLSSWERGYALPSLDMARTLDERLGARGGLVTLWEEEAQARGVPPHLRDDAALGAQARAIDVVTPVIVPGLLQAPAYARHVIAAGRPTDPLPLVDDRVSARCAMLDTITARITAVCPVGALRVVPPTARAAQAHHLVDLVESGRITLHLAPTPLVGVGAPFTLYRLGDDQMAATTEHALDTVVVIDPPDVAYLLDIARTALGAALPPEESLRTLKEQIDP